MVTCLLTGSLVEKMFQIAATIGYAVRHNQSYHIPDSAEFPELQSQPPQYGGQVEYNEPNEEGYHEIPFHNDIILVGRFQHEDYFSHCRKRIKYLFGESRYKMMLAFLATKSLAHGKE